ncbi:MAG: retropepsin-like aspartic protease family protein [Arenicella sp.]
MRNFLIGSLLFLSMSALAQESQSVQLVLLFKQGAILNIDGKNKKLKLGQVYNGVKLLSVESSSAEISVNGNAQELTIGGSGLFSNNAPSRPAKKRSTRLSISQSGLFFVDVTINRQKNPFVVDTGANLVVISSELAEQLDIDYKQAPRSIATTAAGRSQFYAITIPTMSVDGIEVDSVQAGVIEGTFPEVPLLGTSVLERFLMQRDGEIMQLTLQ